VANYLIELWWHDNLRNMRRMSFFVFIGIAFSSEIAKFLSLRLIFYKLPSFEGPLEGILYSIFISLGFAALAVVLYAYGIVGTETKFNDMTLFLYTYPFASITFATLMGFFIGMGKLRTNWLIDNATGIFASTFFHGLFYFCFITSDKRLLLFTTLGFLIITITLIYKAVNFRAERS
jgi:RsiW-degrading membrane proteinase PrsW (M82 family)